MKRILCLLLVLSILASFLLTASAAGSDMQLTLKAENVGKTLKVELHCEGNPGLGSAQFTLSYNDNVIKCSSCETGPALRGMMAAENPNASKGAVIAAASATPIESDGIMAVYTFNIIGDGDYGFALTDTHFADENGGKISYSLKISADKPVVTPPAEDKPVVTPPVEDEPVPVPPDVDDKPIVVPPDIEDAPEKPEKPAFNDMAGHWAEDYLAQAAARDILEGYPDGSCRPNENVTRAQFVTFLWRSVGEPEPGKKSTFSDLDPQAEYYLDAVAWAQESGYIIGVGDNKFLPEAPISRQEVATIIWRVTGGAPGMEVLYYGIYDKHFIDSGSVPDWAKSAVYWAVYNEVWCGNGRLEIGKVLASAEAASRAEIVVMMIKYQDKFEG